MKNSRLTFALLAACTALPASGLFAQTTAPAATPSVSAPAATAKAGGDVDDEEGANGAVRKAYMALTPEERQKVRAARKAASKDPAVIAAKANRATDRKGFRKAMRDAMVKSDPGVEPLIDKLAAATREKRLDKKGL